MRLLIMMMFVSQFALANNGEVARAYFNNYADVAISEMHRTGIPASIKLAQGLLESDWGRSDLARTANNHFGIKCGRAWEGDTFYKEDDDRNKEGKLIKSCFRAFNSPLESYMAHSDFLTDPKKEYRYGFLFEYKTTDYKAWAKGLKKSGYATDPKYPQKLISIIEKYKLDQFDSNVSIHNQDRALAKETKTKEKGAVVISDFNWAEEKSRSTKRVSKTKHKEKTSKHLTSRLKYSIETNNSCRMVVAKGGESVADLSKNVGISIDELLSINEILSNKDQLIDAETYIYIEKKKRSWRGGELYHIVKPGETMESIAQLYGMRLRSLFAKNRMPNGSETFTGVKLSIKKTVSLSERPQYIKQKKNSEEELLFANDDSVQ